MKTKKFRSENDWQYFCNYIVKNNRYVLNDEWLNFINKLLFTAKKREIVLEKGWKFVRARIGSYEKEIEENGEVVDIVTGPRPKKELLAPPPEKSKDARINPRGISYLYLSNKIHTAISEVRPLIDQKVSVGVFKIVKNLKCIDTSQDRTKRMIFWGNEIPKLSEDEKEEYIWGDINQSFSSPIRSKDETIDYIPTQYLSEIFKNHGYDGIVYKSSLDKEGYNIVLFDQRNACISKIMVYKIESVNIKHKECDKPIYYCRRKSNKINKE